MYMNKVILCGIICNKPELRETHSGVPVTNFTIKTMSRWNIQNESDEKKYIKWHKCVCWGNVAKNAVQILDKGKRILLDGELSYSNGKQTIEYNGVSIPIKIAEIKVNSFEIDKTFKSSNLKEQYNENND